jgi:DNA polymerase-1
MIRIHNGLAAARMTARMVLQVHDELVLEVPAPELEAARGLAKREMEGAASLRVPLVVSLGAGRDWVEAKA